MRAPKPIRIGCSNLTGTPEFYALRSYKLLDNGGMMATGKKDNVTADIMPSLVAARNDARHDLMWELIAAASTMHGDFGIDEDGNLERFNYSTAKWERFSVYGWLVDHLPADSEQDVKDTST